MMAQEEICKKLEEAEERRKYLEEIKLVKLSLHHQMVDERAKSSESL